MLKKIKPKYNLSNPIIIYTKLLLVFFEKDESLTECDEFRVVVPKKNLKKAVQRNRVKRQIRNILYDFSMEEILHSKIVIIGKENSYKAKYSELKDNFFYAISKYRKKLEKSEKT